MSFHIRPALRSSAKLLLGIYAESGRGKTVTALLLARGFVGPTGKICMIETESGRGEIYNGVTIKPDQAIGEYSVISMQGSYSPKEFGQAISAAEAAKVDALIIDSASHEWEGVGGVLDMAAKNQEDGKKGPLVWQRPKMDHSKEFVLRLMGTPIPLVIVCMRAKYPMEEKAKAGGGKEWTRSTVLEPKQSEDILYEMLAHGWIDQDHGFHQTKFPEGFPDLFTPGKPLSIKTGQDLAVWSHGRGLPGSVGNAPEVKDPITVDQVTVVSDKLKEKAISRERLLAAASKALGYEVTRIEDLPAPFYQKAIDWIDRVQQ